MRSLKRGALILSAAMALSPMLLAAPTVKVMKVERDSRQDDRAIEAKHGTGTPRPGSDDGHHQAPKIAANLLGEVDALVSFCSVAEPRSGQRYRDVANKILQASEKDLKESRLSGDYQPMYQAYMNLLNGVPASQRNAACQFLFFGQT